MDFLRSHNITHSRMVMDSGEEFWVRWYPARPDALAYPHMHAFGHPVWEDERDHFEGVGCLYHGLRWRGKKYPAPPGQTYRGEPEWFADGLPAEVLAEAPETGERCGVPSIVPTGGVVCDGAAVWNPVVSLVCTCTAPETTAAIAAAVDSLVCTCTAPIAATVAAYGTVYDCAHCPGGTAYYRRLMVTGATGDFVAFNGAWTLTYSAVCSWVGPGGGYPQYRYFGGTQPWRLTWTDGTHTASYRSTDPTGCDACVTLTLTSQTGTGSLPSTLVVCPYSGGLYSSLVCGCTEPETTATIAAAADSLACTCTEPVTTVTIAAAADSLACGCTEPDTVAAPAAAADSLACTCTEPVTTATIGSTPTTGCSDCPVAAPGAWIATIAGCTGDFAPFNGTWTLTYFSSCDYTVVVGGTVLFLNYHPSAILLHMTDAGTGANFAYYSAITPDFCHSEFTVPFLVVLSGTGTYPASIRVVPG